MIPGVDASHWQGSPDWAKVKKAGYPWCYLKCTDGTSYSYVSWYNAQAPKARAAGLVQGAYHFGQRADGSLQADYLLSNIGGADFLVLDFEAPPSGLKMTDDEARAFARRCNVKSMPKAIYGTGGDVDHLAAFSEFKGWLRFKARYGTTEPTGPWDVWQHSQTGHVDGIAGGCDLNKLSKALSVLTGAEEDDLTKDQDTNLTRSTGFAKGVGLGTGDVKSDGTGSYEAAGKALVARLDAVQADLTAVKADLTAVKADQAAAQSQTEADLAAIKAKLGI